MLFAIQNKGKQLRVYRINSKQAFKSNLRKSELQITMSRGGEYENELHCIQQLQLAKIISKGLEHKMGISQSKDKNRI